MAERLIDGKASVADALKKMKNFYPEDEQPATAIVKPADELGFTEHSQKALNSSLKDKS